MVLLHPLDVPPQCQLQIDACVQANIGTVAHHGIAATTTDSPLPADEVPAVLRVKAAAATLPGSSVNPMSLDYRTRTLRLAFNCPFATPYFCINFASVPLRKVCIHGTRDPDCLEQF